MKTQIEQLIDRLADKSLTFGCELTFGNEVHVLLTDKGDGSYIEAGLKGNGELRSIDTLHSKIMKSEILGHPILIGDVLEKMNNLIVQDGWGVDVGSYDVAKLIKTWQPLGFTKSLQEILASTEWIWVCEECGKDVSEEVHAQTVHGCTRFFLAACPRVPKDKATRDLFEFLLQLDNPNEDE